MGTPKASWQNQVAIQLQVAAITTAGTFATGTFGLEQTSKFLVPVLNRDFSIDPGQKFITDKRAYGTADLNIGEHVVGSQLPTVKLNIPANAYNLKKLFWLLLQGGASEAIATPFLATFIAYTSPACEVWCSIADPITGTLASGNNEAMHGAVLKSVTLKAEQGGQLVAECEFIGRIYSNVFNSGTAIALADAGNAPLLWQDATVLLDSNAINIPGLSITFDNNLESPMYHSAYPVKHLLGDLSITGDITIPRDSGTAGEDDETQITDMLAGTSKKLEVYWGTSPAVAVGTFAFETRIVYNSKAKSNDQEVGNTLPFKQVNQTTALSITAADGEDLGI